MGHSRTPTQNTAGDGFPADPIDGSGRALSVAGCPRTCGYFDMGRRPEVPNRGEPQPFLSAGHEGDDRIGRRVGQDHVHDREHDHAGGEGEDGADGVAGDLGYERRGPQPLGEAVQGHVVSLP